MKTDPSRTAIIGILSGALLLGIYLTCTFISWALYPSALSPLTDMMSHLGNPLYNPTGAAWFNVGNILTGVCKVPFFIGFSMWYTDQKDQVRLVKLAQLAGFVDAAAVVLVGFFAEGATAIHGYIGGFYFITNSTVLTLSFFAFRRHPKLPRKFSLFYVPVLILYYLNAVALGLVPLAEWLAVFSCVGLEGLLVANAVHAFRKG